jgi:hypothetical protein
VANRQGQTAYKQGSGRKVNITLDREAGNEYDPNAVKVMASVGGGAEYHLGYLPKDTASLIASLMDKGIRLAARFRGVTGGFEKLNRGALVEVAM